jgi:hypothetical protein
VSYFIEIPLKAWQCFNFFYFFCGSVSGIQRSTTDQFDGASWKEEILFNSEKIHSDEWLSFPPRRAQRVVIRQFVYLPTISEVY